METKVLEKLNELSAIQEFALLPKPDRIKLAVEIVKLEYMKDIKSELSGIDISLGYL